jgi:hypothetical protein
MSWKPSLSPRRLSRQLAAIAPGLVLGIAMLGADPAVAARETALANAKSPSLRSPLARAQAAARPKPAALSGAYQALLAGDMNSFAVVAGAVLAGRALPPASAPESPAARFFRDLLQSTPAADRDAFLRLGLAGQLSNAGLLERAPRVSLSAEPPARALLLRYLAAFDAPQRSTAPQALLGERLTHYAHFPHPLAVRIAGDLGLAEALPHLERFVRLKRRFYLLRTDYTTHPQEVDALFRESLRAILSIAEKGATTVGAASAVLGRVADQAAAEERGDSLQGDGEPITLETYDDNQGTAPPTQMVRETRLRQMDRTPSKRHWIQLTLRALGGDRAAGLELNLGPPRNKSPRLQVPGAAWIVESDDAQVAVAGRTLFAVTRQNIEGQHQPVLWSLDLETGRSRFVVRLLGTDDKGEESELATRGMCIDPDGSPVLLTTLSSGPAGRAGSLLRFDPTSGEVAAILPLVIKGDESPDLLACDSGGYVLRRGTTLFRQRLTGELGAKIQLRREDRVAVGEGQIVVLTSDGVRVWSGPSSEAKARPFPAADLIGQPSLPSSAIPLALADGFAIANGREGKLQIFDLAGRRRADHNISEGADAFSAASGPLARRSLLGRDQLWVVGPGDRLLQFKVPLNVRELLVSTTAAYVADERSHVEHRLSDGRAHKLDLPGSPHMAKVLAATSEWVIVVVYRDGYYLAALQR